MISKFRFRLASRKSTKNDSEEAGPNFLVWWYSLDWWFLRGGDLNILDGFSNGRGQSYKVFFLDTYTSWQKIEAQTRCAV